MFMLTLHLLLVIGAPAACPTGDAALIGLVHADAGEVAGALQPLVADGGPCPTRLAPIGQANHLLVQADPARLRRLRAVIRRLDQPAYRPALQAPIKLVVSQIPDRAPRGAAPRGRTRQVWHLNARADEEVRLPLSGPDGTALTVQVRSRARPYEAGLAALIDYVRALRGSSVFHMWRHLDAATLTCHLTWTLLRGQRVQFGDGTCESLE